MYCLNATTGETRYAEILPERNGDEPMFYASPLIAGGRLYHLSRENRTYVLPAEPRFEVLARNVIVTDDTIWNASPAVVGNRLLLRSGAALYCVGEPNETDAEDAR